MKTTNILIAAVVLALSAPIASANNLTSLGVAPNGSTAWRITSTADGPQKVTLTRHGSGQSVTYLTNPGTYEVVLPNGAPGTWIATFEDGKRVTKASGPQIYDPKPPGGDTGAQGETGATGPQGEPGESIRGPKGETGADGRSFDQAAYDRQMRNLRGQMAADRATGNLQTRTAAEGQWTGALGISGNEYGADGIAGGVRYGISDRADLYAVVGVSDRRQMSWGVGVTFILGGN